MKVYVDVTEFLKNPITTGIQRIVGEICRYFPKDLLAPVRLENGRFEVMSVALIDAIARLFSTTNQSVQEILLLAAKPVTQPFGLLNGDVLLIPEVFDNAERVAFFLRMPPFELGKCRFIVYDLLPLTHPAYFIADNQTAIYAYYRMLSLSCNCGFISERTRQVYYGRLKRSDDRGGVVLPLGVDSLGPRGDFKPNRPLHFTVIGTIEPRKNHRLILETFKSLLRDDKQLRLTFIGRMGWGDTELAAEIHALSGDPDSGFSYHSAANDGFVRESVLDSRATIYVSTVEGYGLPPVESLWLGTPVIASPNIPSLERYSSNGIHVVDPLHPETLREAVLSFLANSYANRKIEETIDLNLPTWRSFAEGVLQWCKS